MMVLLVEEQDMDGLGWRTDDSPGSADNTPNREADDGPGWEAATAALNKAYLLT